jgi:hypothetical protein
VLEADASKIRMSIARDVDLRYTTNLAATDVTGVFCTSGSEREFTLEGSWYADEEIQAGTDRDVVAAG